MSAAAVLDVHILSVQGDDCVGPMGAFADQDPVRLDDLHVQLHIHEAYVPEVWLEMSQSQSDDGDRR